MRHVSTLIISALALVFSVDAAAQQQAKTPEEREKEMLEYCEKQAEKMAEDYKLEDWQVFYVDSILKHDVGALQEEFARLSAMKVSNSSLYETVSDKWYEQMDKSFRKIFTDEQWASYMKNGGERAAKAREKRRQKASGELKNVKMKKVKE